MPMTGLTKSAPTIANASQAAHTMSSSPRYVPATVRAAMKGKVSARATRMRTGSPAGRGAEARRTGMGVWMLEELFDERGDVVAAAVEHRPDQTDSHPLEAAPGALHLRDPGAVRLDDDHGGVQARPEDRRIAVDVRGRQVEEDEVEGLAELGEGHGHAVGVEQARGAERRLSAGDDEEVRDGGLLHHRRKLDAALDQLGETTVAGDAEDRIAARRAEVRFHDRHTAAPPADQDRCEDGYGGGGALAVTRRRHAEQPGDRRRIGAGGDEEIRAEPLVGLLDLGAEPEVERDAGLGLAARCPPERPAPARAPVAIAFPVAPPVAAAVAPTV